MCKPVLWICGGGPGVPFRYGYGYWTGPDSDLLCVIEGIDDAGYAEQMLSPISRSRIVAFLRYLLVRHTGALAPTSEVNATRLGEA